MLFSPTRGSHRGMLDSEAAQYESRTLSSLLEGSGLMESILGPDDTLSYQQSGEGSSDPRSTASQDRKGGMLLLVATLLDAGFYSITVPFLPPEMLNKGITTSQVGMVYSAYGATLLGTTLMLRVSALAIPPTVLVEAAIFVLAASAVLFLLSSPAELMWLVMARAVQGIASALLQTGVAMRLQESEAGENALSSTMLATVISMTCGPFVGGVLVQFGGEASVWLISLVSFVLFGVAFHISSDHEDSKPLDAHRHQPFREICSLWVLALSLGVGIVSAVISGMLPIIPPYLAFRFEMSASMIGMAMTGFLGCYAFQGALLGGILEQMEPLSVLTVGFGTVAGALCLLMLDFGAFGTIVALCVVGSLAGMSLSPAMSLMFQAANMLSPATFWQVNSLYDLSFAAGVAVGPLLGCGLTDQALAQEKHRPLFYQLMLSLILVSGYALLLIVLRKYLGPVKEMLPVSLDEPQKAGAFEEPNPNERTGLLGPQPSLL